MHMSNTEKIIQSFKVKFDNMSAEEKKIYLDKMGLKYHKRGKESRGGITKVHIVDQNGHELKVAVRGGSVAKVDKFGLDMDFSSFNENITKNKAMVGYTPSIFAKKSSKRGKLYTKKG